MNVAIIRGGISHASTPGKHPFLYGFPVKKEESMDSDSGT